MAENNIRKTIQNNLDIVKGSTSTFFTGVDDLISSARMDPIVTGYSFIRLLDVPSWFNDDPDLKYFKDMIHKNTRGFSGISDIELQQAQHTTGFAGNEFNVVTGITRGNTEFTLTHKEYAGSPMRRLYQKYISLIRDFRTGLALYPSIYNVDYGSRNHSCTLLYIQTKPSLLDKDDESIIEFAAFYSNAVPNTIPLSDLYGTYEAGQQESPTITVNWTGFPEFGPDVDELAKRVLRDEILDFSENGDGIPFIDSFGSNKESVDAVAKSGWLKDIYKPEG